MKLHFKFLLPLLFLLFLGCEKHEKKPKAAVVSARAEASKIGLEIMKQGGNRF